MTNLEFIFSETKSMAKTKRVIIETACTNAHVYAKEARDILCKYISTLTREADLNWAADLAAENYSSATRLFDAAFGWFSCNVSWKYCGMSTEYIFSRRGYLKPIK